MKKNIFNVIFFILSAFLFSSNPSTALRIQSRRLRELQVTRNIITVPLS